MSFLELRNAKFNKKFVGDRRRGETTPVHTEIAIPAAHVHAATTTIDRRTIDRRHRATRTRLLCERNSLTHSLGAKTAAKDGREEFGNPQ